jgi:creatinine amidohydrolase/Fe(II)-dependent formamide hydrolase-like protein
MADADPVKLGMLTREVARERFRAFPIAILPVGSCEQHGPHLPLDTDAHDARYVAEEAARRSASPRPVVLPMIPYGVSMHHLAFPGTVSITPKTLIDVVCEIAKSVSAHGVRALVVVNGHGGNTAALSAAGQLVKHDLGMEFYIYEGWQEGRKLFDMPEDVHAGGFETSTSLVSREELVDRDAIPEPVETRYPIPQARFGEEGSVGFAFNTDELSPTGVLGDATKIDLEKAREFWELSIDGLVSVIEELRAHLRGP